MPKTTEERLKEITRPAVCDLLPVRDFLDDVMIRADGSYVAGFHLGGALSYFMDDEGRNQTKRTLESLFLTIPEESMRVQFRYEVIENVGSLLERYEAARTTTLPHVIAMDQQRVEDWRGADRAGEFLTRVAAVYFIWNPEVHARGMAESGGPLKKKDDAKNSGGGIIWLVQVPILVRLDLQEHHRVQGKAFRESQSIRIAHHGHGNISHYCRDAA